MRKLRHAVKILLAAALFTCTAQTGLAAYADSNVIIAYEKNDVGPGQGWREQEDGSWMYQKNGEMLKNCWQEIDGKQYRFNENGTMLTGLQTIDGSIYILGSDGAMLTGVQSYNGQNYWLQDNGAAYTGWQIIDGRKYYFGSDGVMRTGWQTIDGSTYYFTETADASHPLGAAYVSEQTAGGSRLDAEGKLIKTAADGTRYNPYGDVSCIEVDLTNQKVYAYTGSQLVLSSDCVTGNETKNAGTPAGDFRIYAKQTDRVLRGTNFDGSKYESPVSFWMPFNGGIGLHDATWRSSFGGNIYYASGSHGCVNMPFAKAQALYGLAYVGMPVHVHK